MSDFIQSGLEFLVGLGYWGVFFAFLVEIIPTEILLSFVGFYIAQGEFNFWIALVVSVLGGTLAQIFVYWFGRYGGRPLVLKYGKYIFIKEKHVVLAEKWFDLYGTGVVLSARFVPIVRHAISIPAGFTKMDFWKFTGLTAIAIVPWSMMFLYFGMILGENWDKIDEKTSTLVTTIFIIAVALFLIYFFLKRRSVKNHSNIV